MSRAQFLAREFRDRLCRAAAVPHARSVVKDIQFIFAADLRAQQEPLSNIIILSKNKTHLSVK